MQNSVRTKHNPALEHAAHLSNVLRRPLRVAYFLDVTAADGRPLPERHALFLLQGLNDVKKGLKDRQVPFVVFAAGVDIAEGVEILAESCSAVVTDASYLRYGIQVRKKVGRALKVPLFVVEGDVVVPVEEVSTKAEYAARTIRPKITGLMDDFLVRLEEVKLEHQSEDDSWGENVSGMDTVDVTDMERVLKGTDGLDRGATRVKGFPGGEEEAQQVLKTFLKEKFADYGADRNEPAKQMQSDLSPYLRAGNISPVDIALQAKEAAKGKRTAVKESEASFLEELVVRRELAVNACWFNQDVYDVYEHIVPQFAQKSLEEHKADKRPEVYTYEQLEAGLTSDEYWNAAQLELVVRGKMHGYMRMYWAKQILGWVEDPATAMDYGLRLNNRWELDAVDPNSYAGVIWCFGLHDHGWQERPIWGKVRYMNESGLKRKFDMAAYVTMVHKMVANNDLPEHIAKLRKGSKPKEQQQTIEETTKRSRSSKTNKSSSTKPSPNSTRESQSRAAKRHKA